MRSANQLRITVVEHDALVTVRDMLMSGEIRHHHETDEPVGNQLDMQSSGMSSERGAVACVGGFVSALVSATPRWMSGVIRVEREAAKAYVGGGHSAALRTLYRPLQTRHGASIVRCDGEPLDYPWELITPREAAAAIESFLYHGKPHWSDILFDNLPRAEPGIVFPDERLVELFEAADLAEAA